MNNLLKANKQLLRSKYNKHIFFVSVTDHPEIHNSTKIWVINFCFKQKSIATSEVNNFKFLLKHHATLLKNNALIKDAIDVHGPFYSADNLVVIVSGCSSSLETFINLL
jgi:hypothetical protein